MKKIFYIVVIQIFLIILIGCNRNDSNSNSNSDSRYKIENLKQKYYGTFKGWDGKDSSKIVLFNKAYRTSYYDSTNVCYDYEIDNSVLRLFNPRYQMNKDMVKVMGLFHEISYDYKEIVIFYDIIDSTSFKGLNIVYTKQK